MFTFKNVDWKTALHYALFIICTFFLAHITDLTNRLVSQGIDNSVVDSLLALIGICIKVYVMPNQVVTE